jgi:CBS-domain-containing membrane protein
MPFIDENFFAALAVGLAIFLMVVADLEHPPAAGVSLGLVLNGYESEAVLMVIAGILSLAVARNLLRGWLIDLL